MPPDSTGKKQDGRWQKGQSGNLSGRPPGLRNKATIAAETLLDGEAEAITRKAVEHAKGGDPWAVRLCLERLLPPRRDRPINFRLPSIEKPADAVQAASAILEGVANGTITPIEAGELGRLVEGYVRAIEASDFERRLARLEERDSNANT
jgi:Family of unknown function (DUF5681)